MTITESCVLLMHGSDGKSQSTEDGGALCHGSEMCDSQRALWWHACARHIETLSRGKLSGIKIPLGQVEQTEIRNVQYYSK